MYVRKLLKCTRPFVVDREEIAEWFIGRKLWGYPDLVKEFHDRVRPALAKVCDEREERERREEMAAILGQDVGDVTAFILAYLSSQTARFDDGSGPSNLRQTNVHLGSLTQQDDRPVHPDEHFLFTRPASTEAPEPTSADPDFLLDVPRIREGSNLSNELVEVASTSQYEDERSRVAQRKGKARE